MRKVDIPKIHDSFEADMQALFKRASRIKSRLTGKKSGKRDRHWVYEMSLVSACTLWERFSERLFYAYLNRDSTRLSKTLDLKLPKHLSDELCEAIFTVRGYLDIHGLDHQIKLGKKYLVSSPFNKLSKVHRKWIARAFALRNSIVHQSRAAKRHLKSNHEIKRRPGIHLAASERGHERIFRYLAAMLAGSTKMRPS